MKNNGKVVSIRRRTNRGRILFVAYPLLPVSRESAGGAEQVLSTVENEAAVSGWQTTVAACSGSVASGSVYATGVPGSGRLNGAHRFEDRHCRNVLELVSIRSAIGTPFDLIHDHSGSFFANASHLDTPVLATLHLPRAFYPKNAFARIPANLYFNCVSRSQARTFADLPNLIGVVQNGIPLDRFPLQTVKKDYLLWMGRICEEKGTHTALDVAAKSGLPIVIAGQVYPFAYHRHYFETQVRPRLQRMGAQATFIETPTFARKVDLLRHTRAVVITSSAEETSSLVAMEAAACGTPVVALKRGAASEIVAHKTTGFVVNEVADMAAAIANVHAIKPRACRDHAQQNFSASRMFRQYEEIYERLARRVSVRSEAAIAA